MEIKHHGKIVKGKFELYNKEAFVNYVARLKDGEYTLILRPKSEVRSHALNNYLHGIVLKTISEHTGYTLEESKTLMKEMFAPKIILNNSPAPIPKSTAKMTTEELVTFIEQIKVYWAEQSVYIPDPIEMI